MPSGLRAARPNYRSPLPRREGRRPLGVPESAYFISTADCKTLLDPREHSVARAVFCWGFETVPD